MKLTEKRLGRFLDKVCPEPNTGCWLWTGAGNGNGYGMFGVGSKLDGTNRPALAHRVSYEHFVGPIPHGLHLDHLCRVRCCVNPDHLEAVTQRENVLRGNSVAAVAVRNNTCSRGHAYDDANTYTWTNGKRYCRACHASRELARKRALRAAAAQ